MKLMKSDYIDLFNFLSAWKTLPEMCEKLDMETNDVWRALRKLQINNIVVRTEIDAIAENNFSRHAYIQHPDSTSEDAAMMSAKTIIEEPVIDKNKKIGVTVVSCDDYHTKSVKKSTKKYYPSGNSLDNF